VLITRWDRMLMSRLPPPPCMASFATARASPPSTLSLPPLLPPCCRVTNSVSRADRFSNSLSFSLFLYERAGMTSWWPATTWWSKR
jgi:hypothetical protein